MTELTDIVNQFTNLAQQENEEMFQQGILLAEAVAAGFKAADVKRECGIATGKTARTMANRLAVGTVYGREFYVDRDWSLHLATIQLSAVDLAKPDTYQAAHDLMTLALMGNEDGRILTAKTLRERVNPKPVNPKPVTVFKDYEAEIVEVDSFFTPTWRGTALTLRFEEMVLYDLFSKGDRIQVTITRSQPLPESAAGGSDTTKAVAA